MLIDFKLQDAVMRIPLLLLQEKSEKPSTADIPPCSTLFIANLGTTCTKEELEEVLTK